MFLPTKVTLHTVPPTKDVQNDAIFDNSNYAWS